MKIIVNKNYNKKDRHDNLVIIDFEGMEIVMENGCPGLYDIIKIEGVDADLVTIQNAVIRHKATKVPYINSCS